MLVRSFGSAANLIQAHPDNGRHERAPLRSSYSNFFGRLITNNPVKSVIGLLASASMIGIGVGIKIGKHLQSRTMDILAPQQVRSIISSATNKLNHFGGLPTPTPDQIAIATNPPIHA